MLPTRGGRLHGLPDVPNPPRVVLGMTLHNNARHLREAANSILSQTQGDFVLVMLDDGSSDETERIAREIERHDPRVRYVRQPARQGMVPTWKHVVEIAARDGVTNDTALALAAAVERDSEHTIARGIVSSAQERGLTIPSAERFRALPGHGVEAEVAGRELRVGGPALLRSVGASTDPALQAAVERAAARGQTVAVDRTDGDVATERSDD